MTEGEVVLTQDESSGMVHKRVRLTGELASHEADNLDQAGAYIVLGDILDAAYPFRLCDRCFPEPEAVPI